MTSFRSLVTRSGGSSICKEAIQFGRFSTSTFMEFLETFQPSADRKVAQWDVDGSFKFDVPRGSWRRHCGPVPRPWPGVNQSRNSKSDITYPTLNFGALDRTDHAKTHPLGSETEVSYLLDLIGRNFLKFGLYLFRIDNLTVGNQ
jgi:hypothetical protein